MKISKIILTAILATAMTGTSFAATQVEDSTAVIAMNEENTPKEIKVSELPSAVQETLKSDACEAQRAFVLYKEEQKIYQVEALHDGEQVILYFDEEGKKIAQ